MRFHQAPRPLLQLITTILLSPKPTLAYPNGFSLNELFGRACTPCGYYNQLCCSAGEACYTDANSIASCTANGGSQATAASGGYWQYYTTTYVQTDLETITSTMSSYLSGAGATAAATAGTCTWALNEQACGSTCCKSGEYCFDPNTSDCRPAAGGGSSGYYSSYTSAGNTAGAPIRPTSSGQTVITATVSPTTTVPFSTPVATGANVTVTGEQSSGGGGLSGGAIAGIVIGVLAGILLLALICFYCCLRGLLDGCLACFGLGKRKRRVEVEEYERRSHHASGGGGGRTWYGAAKPATRVDRERRENHTGRNLLGIGAGLAALWAILGLKRRRENRRDEKYSEYSYSSDYYTSASE
ncbi:hypothetical protein M409DRAFT_49438 [Zasmidium cellare ATCC 36951]|uniref:Uncharacterized protein n=1 Tax=Zasmidium cellare ATCC 36951 TaxID=1080233 RepID=A0A6A6D0N6_ZASCE|nr:uncharacterized protein M409DRAFT_49438 [Zasmidium cellare ATCC 36951]KAF2172931.1 hypothetical protein M409DRAFT_49438 [Zasmidium cellare ATCC 36951]